MQVKYINKYEDSIIIDSKPSSLRLYDVEGRCGLSNDISVTKTTYTDGVIINSTTLGQRDITIIGKIISNNKTEIENIKKKLIRTFTVKDKGTLYFKSNDEVEEYCIDTIVSNAPIFSQASYNIIDFIIELVAPNPYWRNKSEVRFEASKITSNFRFPLNLPTAKGYKDTSLFVNCNNIGDVDSGMRIEFYAKDPVLNPCLFNVNTRQFIKINKLMDAGERIIINTNAGEKSIISVVEGVETKILQYIDFNSNFIQLNRGDNLLKYQADEGIEYLTCNIYYSPKYLGV